MSERIKVSVAVSPYGRIEKVLDYAIERGLNRHDKYSETPLSEGSRLLLTQQILDSFWLYLDEEGIVLE